MTATRCIAACNELGYSWAGIQGRERESIQILTDPNSWAECRCSKADPRKNTAPVAAINYCAIACNGDASQRCGGWGYVDLYNSPAGTSPSSNSTVDNGVPTLPGYQGERTNMSEKVKS
jgi:hypothetical protein